MCWKHWRSRHDRTPDRPVRRTDARGGYQVTPYWRDEERGLVIYHGDCRDILPELADGEFGSVITDPPYGIGFADWDIPPDSAILQECLRVAEGSVVMFGAAAPRGLTRFLSLSPNPERMLVWHRVCSHVPPAGSTISWRWAALFLWRYDHRQTVIRTDVIRTLDWPRKRAFNHPASKPESIMHLLLRAFGGPSSLDPYMGSGTTLVAAAKLGIPCTGIEIEEKYCEMARCRLEGGFMDDEPAHLFNQEELTCKQPS